MFLFAITPLAPGIKAFQLLFIACISALPFALYKYFTQKNISKMKASDYYFPFIPFLTLAVFIITHL